jgi:hypothetical protein
MLELWLDCNTTIGKKNPFKVLNAKPECKRPSEKDTSSWKDTIKMCLETHTV